MRFLRVPSLALLLGSTLVSAPVLADTLADGPPADLLDIDDEWLTGLQEPTAMTFLPDGRLVITQRGGDVRVRTTDGDLVTAGTISVSTAFQEKGLLNVLAHPDYANNHILYFYYTGSGGGNDDNRVVTMELSDDNVLDTSSEVRLVEGIVAPLNHDGGGLAIYGDYLYIGTGDSGNNSNAEPKDLKVTNYYATCFNVLNGKILRLNLDGSIPDDNPLVGQMGDACGDVSQRSTAPTTTAEARGEIFAWGFRNAFRLWADPMTGNLWVGHVGEVTYEMVNVVPPEGNQHHGWPFREGNEGYEASKCQEVTPNVGDCINAVYHCESSQGMPGVDDYNPDVPDQCDSMTGGLILNGCEWPDEFEGKYVFGDYTNRLIWTLQLNDERNDVIAERVNFATMPNGVGPVEFVEHEGALYAIAYSGNGHITRITPKDPEPSCDAGDMTGMGGAGGSGGSGGMSSSDGGATDGGSGGMSQGGTEQGGSAATSDGGGQQTNQGNMMSGGGSSDSSATGGDSSSGQSSGDPTSNGNGGQSTGTGSGSDNQGTGNNTASAGDGSDTAAAGSGAASSEDAGGVSSDVSSGDDGGCGCRVMGGSQDSRSSGALGLLLAALGLAGLGRRRGLRR